MCLVSFIRIWMVRLVAGNRYLPGDGVEDVWMLNEVSEVDSVGLEERYIRCLKRVSNVNRKVGKKFKKKRGKFLKKSILGKEVSSLKMRL